MRVSLILLAGAIASGCTTLDERVGKILDMPIEVKSADNYVVSHEKRSVTISSEWDWIGYVASATISGTMLGSGSAGLAVTSATTNPNVPSADLPGADVSTVDVSKLYEQVSPAIFGKKFLSLDSEQKTYILLTPSINLYKTQGNAVYQCALNASYHVDGKSIWSRNYKNVSAGLEKSLGNGLPSIERFKPIATRCLSDVTHAYLKHHSGEILAIYKDKSFKYGLLMYRPESGQKNVYFRDDQDGLIYSIWMDGLEIARPEDIQSLEIYDPQ